MSIISQEKTLAFAHLEKYKKKSDITPVVFKKLIDQINIKAKDITGIYVVNGPGSFMGIRAGLVFGKTIALLTSAKFYSVNNLKFISAGIEGKYHVDARGTKSYEGNYSNGKVEVQMVPFVSNSIIDYALMVSNPDIFLNLFSEVKDIPNFEATYFKEPQIGGA